MVFSSQAGIFLKSSLISTSIDFYHFTCPDLKPLSLHISHMRVDLFVQSVDCKMYLLAF